jgi:hypothetical protein
MTDQRMQGTMDSHTAECPTHELVQLITGFWVSQAIYVAAKLGIADLLAEGPRTSGELAQSTGMHEPSLYRVRRALASVDVLAEQAERRFALAPAAACLRSDVPQSQRGFAIMMGEPWNWRAIGEMLYSVRTGLSGFDKALGMPVFDFYAQNPDAAQIEAEGQTSRSLADAADVISAYRFADAHTVIDVGGGQGTLLASILGANPSVRGVLFDMPHMIELARQRFEQSRLCARCELVAGDFFKAIPSGGDIYVMKRVVHDWDDEHAYTILHNCSMAMTRDARLLLIERIVPEHGRPAYAKLLDLMMLVIGGRERTNSEHRDLLGSAGLSLERVIPTVSGVSVLEAVPVNAPWNSR